MEESDVRISIKEVSSLQIAASLALICLEPVRKWCCSWASCAVTIPEKVLFRESVTMAVIESVRVVIVLLMEVAGDKCR